MDSYEMPATAGLEQQVESLTKRLESVIDTYNRDVEAFEIRVKKLETACAILYRIYKMRFGDPQTNGDTQS